MPVAKPPIIWIPAHPDNVLTRPVGVQYEALVWHTTVGGHTIEALGSWFAGGNLREGLRGSTHFGVDRQGRIGQFVNLDQMAIAHGQDDQATARLARDNAGLTANAWAIGIEHLDGGTPGSVTPEQVAASAWLSAWLWETQIAPHAATTGATLDRDHCLGHYELAPRTRTCPVWPEFRYQEQIARIAALLTPTPPEPPQPPPYDGKLRAYENLITVEIREKRAQAARLDTEAAGLRIQAQNAQDVLGVAVE